MRPVFVIIAVFVAGDLVVVAPFVKFPTFSSTIRMVIVSHPYIPFSTYPYDQRE